MCIGSSPKGWNVTLCDLIVVSLLILTHTHTAGMDCNKSDNDWTESFKAELKNKLEAKRERFEHEVAKAQEELRNDRKEQLRKLKYEQMESQQALKDRLMAQLKDYDDKAARAREMLKKDIQEQRNKLEDALEAASAAWSSQNVLKTVVAEREKFECEAAESQETLTHHLEVERKMLEHDAANRLKKLKGKHKAQRKMMEQTTTKCLERMKRSAAKKRETFEHEAAEAQKTLMVVLKIAQ